MNPNYQNPYLSNPNMYSQNKNNQYPQQSNQNQYPQQSNQNQYPNNSNNNPYNQNPYNQNPYNQNPNMSNQNPYNQNPNPYNQNPNNYNQNNYNQNPNNQNRNNQNRNNQNSMMNNMGGFARQIIMNYADSIFDKHDQNGSGKLDVKEIYPATCELFQTNNLPCPSYQQVLYIMRSFDDNGDGLIDKGEFRNLLFKLNGI